MGHYLLGNLADLHHSHVPRFGYISGIVTIEGIPGARRVFLTERKNQLLIAETTSDDAGAYRFDNLDAQRRYTVHAIDHTDTHNAVIADNLAPVAY